MIRIRFPILLLCAVALPACQQYRSSPLDLRCHHAAVTGRDPSSIEVVAYAGRLARPATQPSAFNASDGLSLAEAEVVALFFNPELRVARLKANVPRVGAREAGRWEDPQLGIDGERIVEDVDDPWVLGGVVNVTIPLSGRLGFERDKAASEATAEELRALAEERRVLAELRAAWSEWVAAGERAEITRKLLGQLEPVVERADRLRAAGELDPVDARLLQIERVAQTAKMRRYQAEARAAELELKTRMGLAPAAPVELLPALPALAAPDVVADDALPALVAEHPRVRLAQAEYEVAERTFRLEVQKQYPDITVGGGVGTDEGDKRVLFGVALPLPLFNANRRAIAEARANREAARAAAEGEYERLLAEAWVAQTQVDAARRRLAYVEKELAPLADQQVTDAQRLGQLGDFNTLVLLESLKTAHEARLEVLEARLDLALSSRRLEAVVESELLEVRQAQEEQQ